MNESTLHSSGESRTRPSDIVGFWVLRGGEDVVMCAPCFDADPSAVGVGTDPEICRADHNTIRSCWKCKRRLRQVVA